MADTAYAEARPIEDAPGEAMPEPPRNVVEDLRAIMALDNLAPHLEDGELSAISIEVLDEFDIDYQSMDGWRQEMKGGLELARMVKTDKKAVGKASNVCFPLVASAALQFNARAYPAIVPSESPVKVKVNGADPQGQKAKRAERVQEHMGWQLTEQIPEWETETDSLLTLLPIVGTMHRKVWYNPAKGRTQVKLVDPESLIVNDKVKALQDAPRVSETLMLYPHEIKERVRAGLFVDHDYGDAAQDEGAADKSAAHEFIEQHRRIDIDLDGYPEPYIVTVHRETGKVARIVANFGEEDIHLANPDVDDMGQPMASGVTSIDPRDYYIKYDFLPSLDGGYWATGLGLLLGDLSHAINSAINILIDAGHRNSMGGGFIGAQDFRLKGGPIRFDFGEWKQVNFAGADIRNGTVPLQFPEPSPTLFQMLGLLIEAGREIASIKDVVTGEVNRNMTATTTLALIEQGTAVFTAAYKRIFRSLGREFRLLCEINARHVSDEEYAAFHDEAGQDGKPVQLSAARDYDMRDMGISPTADPRSVTSMQRMAKAQMLMEMAAAGLVSQEEAAKRVLEAGQFDDIEALTPPPDPMTQQLAMRQAQHADAMMAFERMKAEVEVGKMMADIEKSRADAAATMAGIEFDRVAQALDASKARLTGMLELLKMEAAGDAGGTGGMAGAADDGGPVVADAALGGGAPIPDMQGMVGGAGPGPGMVSANPGVGENVSPLG